jgi:hypothetical protein
MIPRTDRVLFMQRGFSIHRCVSLETLCRARVSQLAAETPITRPGAEDNVQSSGRQIAISATLLLRLARAPRQETVAAACAADKLPHTVEIEKKKAFQQNERLEDECPYFNFPAVMSRITRRLLLLNCLGNSFYLEVSIRCKASLWQERFARTRGIMSRAKLVYAANAGSRFKRTAK